MKLLAMISLLLCAGFVSANNFLMLGHIERVTLEVAKSPFYEQPVIYDESSKEQIIVMDHSCAFEEIEFRVAEYIQGSGRSLRKYQRVMPSYGCGSSWPGYIATYLIKAHTDDTGGIQLDGVFEVHQTSNGLAVVNQLGNFFYIVLGDRSYIGQKDEWQEERDLLLETLEEPLVVDESIFMDRSHLDQMQQLGILDYKIVEIDPDRDCLAKLVDGIRERGCNNNTALPYYEITYFKVVPIARLRGYDF